MRDIVNIAMANMSPNSKKLLFKETINESLELQAIVVLANHFNYSVYKVGTISKDFLVMNGNKVNLEDVPKVVQALTSGQECPMVSKATFTLASCCVSPTVLGLSPGGLRVVLRGITMTPKEAAEILGVTTTDRNKPSAECAICSRNMVSAFKNNICKGCSDHCIEFTKFRRGTFTVPINSENFPGFTGTLSHGTGTLTYLDYKIRNQQDMVIFSFNPEYSVTDLIQLPLPIEEFAKVITT